MSFKFALGTIVVLSTSRANWLADIEFEKQHKVAQERAYDEETERMIRAETARIHAERKPDAKQWDGAMAAARQRIPILSALDSIRITAPVEQGDIRARAEEIGRQNQYLVRYKTGCGCQTQEWFDEDAIFDPEQEAAPEQAGDGGPNPDYVAPEHRV